MIPSCTCKSTDALLQQSRNGNLHISSRLTTVLLFSGKKEAKFLKEVRRNSLNNIIPMHGD